MINRIIEFSARNQFVVFLLIAAAVVAGWWSMRTIPLDAIPDLSDTQVIVYSRWDRSPDIMEDQVTYPIVTAMLGAPKVKDVRGFSDFGYSYVYIIFDEGTDIYWARSRTLEYLSNDPAAAAAGREDGTGAGCHRRRLGLSVRAGRYHRASTSLAELRSLPGLVPALPPASPCRAWRKSRRWAASCGSTRSTSIPTGCRPTTSRSARWSRRCAAATTTSAAGWWSSPAREYMVRGRGYAQIDRRPREDRAARTSASGVPITRARCGQRGARARHPARHRRSGTARATRSPASSSCGRARTRCR